MDLLTRDLLRVATIGSVDDGKSTVIGRLLVDTRQLFDDQLEAVAHASARRGVGDLDLSFVTDGLRAEREQGITIDVAYRYAATPTRKFIIADCPGHVQYTRNMATGASTADLALMVLDVARGLKEQTRRHLCIAALLGVRAIVVAINKMDTVRWSQSAYSAAVDEVATAARELGIADVTCVPTSALLGDNVVAASLHTPWYVGPTILEALEGSDAGAWDSAEGARLPIQWVLRQPGGGRSYAGMVSGEPLAVGDRVTLLPAGISTTVTALRGPSGSRDAAPAGVAVDVELADDLDVSRGDLLAREPLPTVTRELRATVCWFGDEPLRAGARLRVKHTTRSTPAIVESVESRVDVERLEIEPADALATNDIGVVRLRTADPLVVDDYAQHRVTGGFILIDPVSNVTRAAGMVGDPGLAGATARP